VRWIYISPHLDDAAFSTGGLMYEQTKEGIQVEIWTIMSGYPGQGELTDLAKNLSRRWGTTSAEETISMRRAENEKSSKIVGAYPKHFDFLDCMFRRGPSGAALYPSVFLEPQEFESDLPTQIANAISSNILPDDLLVCPLAIGNHVDHIIVRRAVELLRRSLLYYADVPYLLNKPYRLSPKTKKMQESFHFISKAGLDSWLEAIRAYSSQIEMEFKTPDQMEKKITAYWAKRSGINLWRLK
jgi:LmbE family N-acetylglucosaminyl deacetylase